MHRVPEVLPKKLAPMIYGQSGPSLLIESVDSMILSPKNCLHEYFGGIIP